MARDKQVAIIAPREPRAGRDCRLGPSAIAPQGCTDGSPGLGYDVLAGRFETAVQRRPREVNRATAT